MQIRRKTNLFNIYKYNEDKSNKFVEPQFVTFSNYAESLTGNHLAVDNKLFPSAFICLDIPKLNTLSNTESFYKDCLIAHYENKMAFLRDYVVSVNGKENNTGKLDDLKPLDYLLYSIKQFDSSASIVHISDIVEQNYNGIYSDMLLTITVPQEENTYTLSINTETTLPPIDYNKTINTASYLYGWYDVKQNVTDGTNNKTSYSYIYTGPSAFGQTKPVFDKTSYNYNITSYYSYINVDTNSVTNVNTTNTVNNQTNDTIKFNIIIPLFNINNVNPFTSNSNEGVTVSYIKSNNNINLSYCDASNYVPYGVWFCGTNNYVTLKRNTNVDTSDIVQPSWSLVLSSQFSAFPYTINYSTNAFSNSYNNIINELTSYTNVYHDTFASVLVEQKNLTDLICKQNADITSMRKEIDNLKSMVVSLQQKY